jgi:hypothetical protein
MLKVAQEGMFCTENKIVVPLGPLAVGVNEYALPATTLVAGVPDIVGGGGGGGEEAALTVIVNAASEADWEPSLTLMTMPEYVPTFEAVGLPLRSPVAVLKLAQDGTFCAENVSVVPLGPLAEGWNE